MNKACSIAVVLLLLANGGVVCGHDFWIEPSTFLVRADGVVAFTLRVGDGPPGETYPRNPTHVDAFAVFGPRGRSEIGGRRGEDPAGRMRLTEPGTHVVHYRSRPTLIELDAQVFETYLHEVGLEDVIRRRAEAGESDLPARELFSRAAKALVTVGGGPLDGYDRVVGATLELIPQRHPSQLEPGESLPLLALASGAPLPGLLLRVMPANAGRATLDPVRTDETGIAQVPLEGPGPWLVSGVRMTRSADPGADWDSVWVSLTFDAPTGGR